MNFEVLVSDQSVPPRASSRFMLESDPNLKSPTLWGWYLLRCAEHAQNDGEAEEEEEGVDEDGK